MKILTWILKKLNGMTAETIKAAIPYLGIFAFAGCSTHALSEFFQEMARTPSAWYEVASWLVEGFSALIIGEAVQQAKIATSSIGRGCTKQDRRFARILTCLFLLLAIPTIAVSFVANQREFGGDVLLGSLFPSLTLASAIATGLQAVVQAKQRESTSKEEQPEETPKPKKKQEFIARCGCGFSKSYDTERKRTNGKNGHRRGGCKEMWIE